jgi:hypothetical protein
MAATDEEDQSQGPHYISTIRARKFRVRPPNNPIDDKDPPPDSIVLDGKAYIDDRTNSSTADGYTAAGHRIKVTFWITRPPSVSYFTVHFPDLPTPSALLAELPRVLCADGDLVLLRVAICPRHLLSLPQHNDYIVYRAGAGTLQVLPPHPTRLFSDLEVGLLRCRFNDSNDDDHTFFVAALSSAFRRGSYKLDLFDSRTCTWSTKVMDVEPSQKQSYTYSCPTQVIAIGRERGSLAWVDLCQGILICDLLASDDDDNLRYIRLPLLVALNKMRRGASCDRDIAVSSNGTIKYFEMCVHVQPGLCDGTTYISQDWEAAAWTWMDSEKSWRVDFKFKASETLVDKSKAAILHRCGGSWLVLDNEALSC